MISVLLKRFIFIRLLENVARDVRLIQLVKRQSGFKASPTEGLWFNLFGGYNIVANDISPICQPDSTITFAQGETKAMTVGAALTSRLQRHLLALVPLPNSISGAIAKEFINQKPKFQILGRW